MNIESTPIENVIRSYEVRIATLEDHPEWVKTPARTVDMDDERHLAVIIDRVMRYYRNRYRFAGVSSNNIFWNLTPAPIRAILIPLSPGEYITVLNPVLAELGGKSYTNIESCGSIPDFTGYAVPRNPYAAVSGYSLEKEYIELEYGNKDFLTNEPFILASYYPNGWVVQHETDHLDGITIKDKGTPWEGCLNGIL